MSACVLTPGKRLTPRTKLVDVPIRWKLFKVAHDLVCPVLDTLSSKGNVILQHKVRVLEVLRCVCDFAGNLLEYARMSQIDCNNLGVCSTFGIELATRELGQLPLIGLVLLHILGNESLETLDFNAAFIT